MTKELLEQYPHICAEIKDLSHVERDVVAMSSYEYPYTKHSKSVQGVVTKDMNLLMELKAQKLEIEEFVDKLPNSEIRRIVRMRAFEGLNWNDIAAKLGYKYSYYSVTHKYYRVIEKYCG